MNIKTKKDYLRWLASGAILLFIYLIVVFLTPFKRTRIFWISFGFTILSFFILEISEYLTLVHHGDARSRFYGFPILKIAVIYGVVQLILGLIVMIFESIIPVKLILIVYSVLFGFAGLGLIATESVMDQIQNQDANLKTHVFQMRSIQSKVNQMVSMTDNPEINSAVHKLAEEIRFSDPVSNEALESIEHEIIENIDELQSAIIDGDCSSVKQLCKKISTILAERNRLCKLNK